MKHKFIIPIISVSLVIIAFISAFVTVTVEKNKKIRLDESDVTISDIIVDGKKVKLTITAANSLGLKIVDNTYSYENGKLQFKLYGSKKIKMGEPLKEKQVLSLVIEAPGDIEEIYFLTLNKKGEETENLKNFKRGKI